MEFKDWLKQAAIEKPELSEFVTKLNSFFTDAGFNAAEFEKKVASGLKKIDSDITNSINPQINATG